MIKINNKNYDIYDLDTYDTLIERIASDLDTLPKYIYINREEIDKNKESIFNIKTNIEVENILEEIKDIANKTLDFNVLYNKIIKKIETNKLNIEKDVLIPFVIYSGKGGLLQYPTEEFMAFGFEEIQKTTKNIITIPPNIEYIWKNKNKLNEELQNKIKRNKNNVKEQKNIFKNFSKIKKGVIYTEFELQKITFDMLLNIKEKTILEIFNDIQLNKYVPFATTNNIYKILKDFIPINEWSLSLENTIIFKILEKKNIENTSYDDYNNGLLVLNENKNVKVSLDLKEINNVNIYKEEYINRFLSSINITKKDIDSIEETKVAGIFLYPNFKLDKYVFADLVMNDPIFSNLITIDEHEKTTKQKTSIYLHFNIPKYGYISVFLTNKMVEKNDPNLKNKSNKLFPLNSYYIMISISRSDNIESIKIFQELFSKLLVYYSEKYNNIVKYYKQFIPKFGDIEKIEYIQDENKQLKHIVPELFISNYTRKCLQPPNIIDDENAKKEIEKGNKVMVFPKNGDNIEQHNYICNNPKYKDHIYPGLRVNPLENKNKYPYIPCCYTKNQEQTMGSLYRHYYYDEELPTKTGKQQDLFITNKIIPPDMFGTLPKNINKLFDIIDNDPSYIYYRKGVLRSKSSFLQCIIEAMDVYTNGKYGFLKLNNNNEKENYINKYRSNILSTTNYVSSCKQEMYDYDINTIINNIKNLDNYFNPNLYIHLLETYFKCNIFMFVRDELNSNLIVPRHLQSYNKLENNNPIVLIFEHMGSESDDAKYPQCELIVKWKIGEEKNIQYIYDNKNIIYNKLNDIFYNMTKYYILNSEQTKLSFPLNYKKLNLNYQFIDTYGKTRGFEIKYNNHLFTLLTSPLQPFLLPEKKVYILKLDIKNAINFISDMGGHITQQTVKNNKVIELIGFIGNVNIIIPIFNTDIIKDIPISYNTFSYTDSSFNNLSNLDIYNKSKKFTRYIIEYMFWLYSTYIYTNKKKMNDDTIASFSNEKFLIDKNIKYTYIPKNFTLKTDIIKDGKLIIKDNEILKRLIYVLKLEILRNNNKILNYHLNKTIENYYVDISDFDNYNFQVILDGENSLDKWIYDKNINNKLNNSIIPNTNIPYFFTNKLINNNIYIAQNIDSIEKALGVYVYWIKNHVNISNDNPNELFDYKFNLYSYVNKDDIKKFIIDGNIKTYNINILGYKINSKKYFTVLLDL
jgi:hypothetical protein